MKKRILSTAIITVMALNVALQPITANAEEKENNKISEASMIETEKTETATQKTPRAVTQKNTEIVFGKKYSGYISTNSSGDTYTFTLPSSGRITLTASSTIEDTHYVIGNSSTEKIWEEHAHRDPSGQSNTQKYVDLTKGTYRLCISSWMNEYMEGQYEFTLNFSASNESFVETGNGTNNEFINSNAISLNKSYKGHLAKNDNKDFYKFTLSSSANVTFTASADLERIQYTLYNSSKQKLFFIDQFWDPGTKLVKTSKNINLNKGTYYLLASSEYTDYYTGNYTFKLTDHTHSYKTTVSKATPSRNGKIVKTCSCGATGSTSTIYAPKTMSLSTTKYTYAGKVRKPSVRIKDSKGKTIPSSNYKVSYSSGRKYVGRYTVKVTFKGNYSGTMYKKFDIVPKGTSLSKVSKGRKSFTVKWKKNRSQTSGYQIQYSSSRNFKKGAKTVTIKSNKSTAKKITRLKAKKKYYVRVRTYKNTKSSGKTVKLYSGWSKAKSVKTR